MVVLRNLVGKKADADPPIDPTDGRGRGKEGADKLVSVACR